MLGAADIFLFHEFRLDRRGEGLSRRDELGVFVPLPVAPRPLDVLSVLVERAGELITKEEIIAAVWRRSVVENANLTVQIAALRRVLDQGRSEGSCIQTVAARGYRFVAPVTRVEKCIQPSMASHEAVATLPAGSGRPAAPRLSIVVLPFTDLSEDRGQQYFVDGITEDVTTDLSRLPHMLVISRNTAFAYQHTRFHTKQIGHELGVRYVLEGSVRRSGRQVRVNAQLIDADTDMHLWAERFDGETGDLLALQNEITSRIAVALNLELIGAEAVRPTEHPDVLDYILRGRAVSYKPPSREKYAESISLTERALALDPSSLAAQSYLAIYLTARVLDKHDRYGRGRHRACGTPGGGSLGVVSAQPTCTFRQGSGASDTAPTGGGHFRIRDGNRAQSQLDECVGSD